MADESGGVRRDGLGAGRAEIYTYEAPWMIYACNWSVRARRSDSRVGRQSVGGEGAGRRERAGEGSKAVETRARGGG